MLNQQKVSNLEGFFFISIRVRLGAWGPYFKSIPHSLNPLFARKFVSFRVIPPQVVALHCYLCPCPLPVPVPLCRKRFTGCKLQHKVERINSAETEMHKIKQVM